MLDQLTRAALPFSLLPQFLVSMIFVYRRLLRETNSRVLLLSILIFTLATFGAWWYHQSLHTAFPLLYGLYAFCLAMACSMFYSEMICYSGTIHTIWRPSFWLVTGMWLSALCGIPILLYPQSRATYNLPHYIFFIRLLNINILFLFLSVANTRSRK